MRLLCNIPNKENFEFYGIGKHAEQYNCIVKKNHVGCHGIYVKETCTPIYHQLAGWLSREDFIK